MEIDVRNDDVESSEVNIRYSDTEYLTLERNIGPLCSQKGVTVVDEHDLEEYTFYLCDIDNLIKALQKAKELWAK